MQTVGVVVSLALVLGTNGRRVRFLAWHDPGSRRWLNAIFLASDLGIVLSVDVGVVLFPDVGVVIVLADAQN